MRECSAPAVQDGGPLVGRKGGANRGWGVRGQRQGHVVNALDLVGNECCGEGKLWWMWRGVYGGG